MINNLTSINTNYYFHNPPKIFPIIDNYDITGIRNSFPILKQKINGYPLVWFDNAATTQKPIHVIKSLEEYFSEYNSNIHRGEHTLAKKATCAYELSRKKIQKFINAASYEEIIFVRGTTEAINLVANSYAIDTLKKDDEILLSQMEHHSNIVPWQNVANRTGAIIKVIPVNEAGEIILDSYKNLLSPRTKIVSITHVSNILGTINPVRLITDLAHNFGACVIIDGAQAAPHIKIDIKEIDADFYAFSGHKIYGPTGIGILYGKKAYLDKMQPWQLGGGMIEDVDFTKTSYAKLPYKFEAGTTNIADAIALGSAIDFISSIGMEKISIYEKDITSYMMDSLKDIEGLKIIGTATDKTSAISFSIDNYEPDYISKFLNNYGIAVRSGHHCAQPILKSYNLKSVTRASLGIYNTPREIDTLVQLLKMITIRKQPKPNFTF